MVIQGRGKGGFEDRKQGVFGTLGVVVRGKTVNTAPKDDDFKYS